MQPSWPARTDRFIAWLKQPKLSPMQAAGLTLAGGYFREAAAAAAAAPYVCKQGPEEGCKQVGTGGCAESRWRAAEWISHLTSQISCGCHWIAQLPHPCRCGVLWRRL